MYNSTDKTAWMSLRNSSVDKGWGKSAKRFPPTENEQGSWNKFNDLVKKKDNFPFDLSVYTFYYACYEIVINETCQELFFCKYD